MLAYEPTKKCYTQRDNMGDWLIYPRKPQMNNLWDVKCKFIRPQSEIWTGRSE